MGLCGGADIGDLSERREVKMNSALEETKLSVHLSELFYYMFFGILFAAKGIGLEYGQKMFYLCMLAALVCLCGKVLLTAYSCIEWLIMFALVMLGILIHKNSGEIAALAAVLVIIGMKNIPIKRLMGVCLGIWSIMFALSYILGYFHIKDGAVVVHEKLGLGPIIRWSLGYTHPNVLHVSYFILVTLLIYTFAWQGKKLWMASGILFIGNIFVFLYSISYTGVLIVTGYLILNLYMQMRRKISLVEKILLQTVFPVCVIFPIAGPFLLKGKAFAFFNKLLSTRFELVYNIFHEFSPSLLGTRVYFENTMAKLTLDSSFAYLLMYYGIIAFILFVTAYFFLIRYLVKKDMRWELAIVLAVVVAGVTEQFLFNLSFKNITFFLVGSYLYIVLGYGKKDKYWNQEFCVLRKWKNLKIVCYAPWKQWKAEFSGLFTKRKVIFGAVLAICTACCVLGLVWSDIPQSVYVNKWLTDYRNEKEEIYLDTQAVSDVFDSIVLGYNGPDVGMYCFTGNIIKIERIRVIIGAFVLGGIFVLMMAVGFGILRKIRLSFKIDGWGK
ncbi:MAG: hypothetical protein IKC46_15950 [Lachnospiraceae bacterium]|nr:hypothetical protein [Lachnospiraceae bacterium]